VHLLLHGIWAFKVDGVTGGRTDLVYQQPLSTAAISSAVGIIATEWKLCRTRNGDAKFAEARRQIDKYTSGLLAGVELASHRYLVVVTKKELEPTPDETSGGVTYRHINIAVDPDVPSIAAKSAKSHSRG
jgi:hypothetical protein